ncbi:MAG: V-type ATP synthase subunit D [Alphaproteobacteria bacterium]|nr:V-type ATP synthase subunit D [Alphaproteobacteria bacterium]
MTKLAFNKSSLSERKRDLDIYARFLPPLDLKRRQILIERNRARAALEAVKGRLEERMAGVGELIPMLSNRNISLDQLIEVAAARVGQQNLVGVTLPVFESVDFSVRPYGFLAKPHWVDRVVEELRECSALHLERQVMEERLRRLEQAAKKLTQRVNLFDKVLIPRTKAEIREIEIYLSDAERAEVVRSKMAKKKHTGAGL